MATMREIYVYRNGEVVPKGESEPYRGVHVISDTISGLWHPSDGKIYDSKSRFRSVTKAHGGIEVGNEKQRFVPQMDRVSKADVAKAIDMVKQGYRPNVAREGEL